MLPEVTIIERQSSLFTLAPWNSSSKGALSQKNLNSFTPRELHPSVPGHTTQSVLSTVVHHGLPNRLTDFRAGYEQEVTMLFFVFQGSLFQFPELAVSRSSRMYKSTLISSELHSDSAIPYCVCVGVGGCSSKHNQRKRVPKLMFKAFSLPYLPLLLHPPIPCFLALPPLILYSG